MQFGVGQVPYVGAGPFGRDTSLWQLGVLGIYDLAETVLKPVLGA